MIDKTKEFETKPIAALLWQYALPAVITQIIASIYNICDRVFLGQCVGALAIAGLTVTMPIMNIIHAFGSLVGAGAGARMSIVLGKRDIPWAENILGNTMLLSIFFGLLYVPAWYIFNDDILSLFGASAETIAYAKEYMNIVIPGMFFTTVTFNLTSLIRSTGYSKKSMWIMIYGAILNILLDALFIFGFKWGISGAALATVIAQTCGFILTTWYLRDGSNKYVHFKRNIFQLKAKIIAKIISIGLAPFSVNICGCFIVVVLNHALLEQGGADGDLCVGANGITNRVTQLLILMVAGFSQGMQPIVGFNIGAQLFNRVREVLVKAIMTATIILTTGYILIAIFPAMLASLFTSDPVLIEYCIPALRISCRYTDDCDLILPKYS